MAVRARQRGQAEVGAGVLRAIQRHAVGLGQPAVDVGSGVRWVHALCARQRQHHIIHGVGARRRLLLCHDMHLARRRLLLCHDMHLARRRLLLHLIRRVAVGRHRRRLLLLPPAAAIAGGSARLLITVQHQISCHCPLRAVGFDAVGGGTVPLRGHGQDGVVGRCCQGALLPLAEGAPCRCTSHRLAPSTHQVALVGVHIHGAQVAWDQHQRVEVRGGAVLLQALRHGGSAGSAAQ